MKKILFAIAIVLTLGLTANAQRDGFFGNNDNYNREESGLDIGFPGGHNALTDTNGAPLGTGLFILTALGAGYAVARKKK